LPRCTQYRIRSGDKGRTFYYRARYQCHVDSTGLLMNSPGGEASAILGPDGRLFTAPLDPAIGGLIHADLDFTNPTFAEQIQDNARGQSEKSCHHANISRSENACCCSLYPSSYSYSVKSPTRTNIYKDVSRYGCCPGGVHSTTS
jgi:hypothetical protein